MERVYLFGAYVALCVILLRALRRAKTLRAIAFGLINFGFFWAIFFRGEPGGALWLLRYAGIVALHYLALAFADARKSRKLFALAQVLPLAVLVAAKIDSAIHFIGISYVAFRLIYLSVEVREELVPLPSPAEMLAYAFFVPLIQVGPISPFRPFKEALDAPQPLPWFAALVRILMGLVKFRLIAEAFRPLTPPLLFFDELRHGPFDLVVAGGAELIYLYCDFSGYVDVMIGIAALLGFAVKENFQSPLSARNIQDFWNRWHISLTHFMRDIVYNPLLKVLGKRYKQAVGYDQVVASCILVTFLLTGIWHGFTLNFLAYGIFHAFGLVVFYYYNGWLRRRLGVRLKAYLASPIVAAGARILTLSFVCTSFFLFSLDAGKLRELVAIVSHRH